jgi:hypothetical protein
MNLMLVKANELEYQKLTNRSDFFELCKKTIEDRGEYQSGLLDGLK